MQRALLTGWTIAIVVACGGPASHSTKPTAAELAAMQAEFAPFQPAFQSLEAALDARDDELATRILARIFAREPTGVALERARGFERILEGRAWVSQIQLRLEAVHLGSGDEWTLAVVATHSGDVEMTLRGGPPTLRVQLLGVSPSGFEQRYSHSRSIDALASWPLPAGVESRVDLGRTQIPVGSALAVRALFELEFLPGEIVRDGESRPSTHLPVPRAEAVHLAAFLPVEPVDPAELVRYVREELIRPPPLLERAVRIPLEQRARTLDLLTPAVLELPTGEVEKIAVALRWLSGENRMGADARSWRQWLDRRAKQRRGPTPAQAQGSGSLDLPADRSYRQ